MAILSAVVLFFIVIMIAYLLLSASKKTDSLSTDNSVSSAADQAESEAGLYESSDEIAEQETNASAENTFLYSLNEDTEFYAIENGTAYFDYSDGTLDGLYTGRPSDIYDGYVQLDYKDGEVLVESCYAMPISGAKILPAGVFSQITSQGVGYSGCAVACLYLMLKSENLNSVDSDTSYESLLSLAENNGYADQGSLLSLGGGMTFESMQAFCNDVFGRDLINAYSQSENPSDTVKKIIDSGKQATVLVKHSNGKIIADGELSHFIVITGYTESNGETYFIYANTYYTSNTTHGNPLLHISSEQLNETVNSDFSESKAIAYLN
jgi:hypothetical protein